MEITRLIINKELTQLMNEIRILSEDYGIEHGFTIFYRDGSMFPGNICAGTDCDINIHIKLPFLTHVFGSVHTHPVRKKIKDCYDKKSITEEQMTLAIQKNQSGASINDLLTSIEDLFVRGDLTDSAILVLSDVDIDNNISIYIPKRTIPPEKFRDALVRLENDPEPEFEKICGDIVISPDEEDVYNFIYELFYNFKFSIPSDKDIIIERNNKTYEYKLVN